jgi:hypothetical protein
MSACRKYRARFVEAFYDELSAEQKQRFDEHLQGCPECAVAFAELRSVVKVMDQRQRPTPEPEFWQGYWHRLAARLEGARRPARVQWWRRLAEGLRLEPAWAYRTVAAAALVVAGILIGKLFYGGPATEPSQVTRAVPAFEAEVVDARAERYIERSKLLLLALVNFDPETEYVAALDLPRQQEVSRALIQEAALLKDQLTQPDQQRFRELITDLEVILLQIANLESEYDLPMIDLVKSGVDRRAIFLKINLEEMRRTERKAINPKVTPRGTGAPRI